MKNWNNKICTFFNFFSLDDKIFATSEFSNKMFLKWKVPPWAYFVESDFFQIHYFFFRNSFLKTHSKNGRFWLKASKLRWNICFYFYLLITKIKDPDHRIKFILFGFILFLRKNQKFIISEKFGKNNFWHIVRNIFSSDEWN